jgi:hypothetical protein
VASIRKNLAVALSATSPARAVSLAGRATANQLSLCRQPRPRVPLTLLGGFYLCAAVRRLMGVHVDGSGRGAAGTSRASLRGFSRMAVARRGRSRGGGASALPAAANPGPAASPDSDAQLHSGAQAANRDAGHNVVFQEDARIAPTTVLCDMCGGYGPQWNGWKHDVVGSLCFGKNGRSGGRTAGSEREDGIPTEVCCMLLAACSVWALVSSKQHAASSGV